MTPLTVSVQQAAETLGIGRTSIYALINQGKLQIIKIGRRTLVLVSSLRQLVEEDEV